MFVHAVSTGSILLDSFSTFPNPSTYHGSTNAWLASTLRDDDGSFQSASSSFSSDITVDIHSESAIVGRWK